MKNSYFPLLLLLLLLAGNHKTCAQKTIDQVTTERGLTNRPVGKSNAATVNANAPAGTYYQDLKRSAGYILLFRLNEKKRVYRSCCSMNLLNNVRQEKKAYFSTAYHCFRGHIPEAGGESIVPSADTTLKDQYLSLYYEQAHGTERGLDVHATIRRVWKVDIKFLVVDPSADLILFEVLNEKKSEELLEHTYAAGFDVKVLESTVLSLNNKTSFIGHPKGDHKKIYASFPVVKTDDALPAQFDDYIYDSYIKTPSYGLQISEEPLIGVQMEGGTSGSGLQLANTTKISSVLSGPRFHHGRFISYYLNNSWYPNKLTSKGMIFYLDPDTTYLTDIPGGGYHDRIEKNSKFNSNLTLSPDINFFKPHLSLNYQAANRAANFEILGEGLDKSTINPSSMDSYSGLKLSEASADNTVAMAVFYRYKENKDEPIKRFLIYGCYASPDVVPNTLGFQEQGWDCNNPPPGFPPCRRDQWLPGEDKSFGDKSLTDQGKSTDMSRSFHRAMLSYLKQRFNVNAEKKINLPVSLLIKSIDNESNIVAVNYPGQVPRNALQMSNPEHISIKNYFQSRRYKASRGQSSENLYIDSLAIRQTPASIVPSVTRTKRVSTGNNGGYVNLVNPNYRLLEEGVELTYNEGTQVKRNFLDFKINVTNTSSSDPYSYAIYLDYFKDVDNNHYYNFVNDPTLHTIERIETGTNITGTETEIAYELPHYSELGMSPGNTRKTRLRVVVKAGAVAPGQDEIFSSGEAEDYLIELYVPDCEKMIPVPYNKLANMVLSYCPTEDGSDPDDNYQGDKEGTQEGGVKPASGTGTQIKGSFSFGTTHNVRYASAKAVSSWYANTNALGGAPLSPTPAPSAAAFNPEYLSVPTAGEEADPGQLIDQNMAMDIYYPLYQEGRSVDELAALPLIIYLPDGAFAWNRRQTDLTRKTCEWFAGQGNVVAAIDYRVGIYGEEEISKRAMIRAWQDSRAAVKWWSMPQNEIRTDANGDLLWKIDQDEIYVLGHGAGGITALHNLYLYEQLLDEEVNDKPDGSDGLLAAIGAGYDLNGQSTYDLRDYKPIPCIDINGVNTCDGGLINRAADGTYGQYAGSDADVIHLLAEYNASDLGQAKKAVSMGGGLLNDEWILGDGTDHHTPKPAALIHHEDDEVVDYNVGHPVVRSFGQSVNATLSDYEVAEIDGSGEIQEAWENATDAHKGVLRWVDLDDSTNTTAGGGGNYLPYHVPQYGFYDDDDADGDYDSYVVSGRHPDDLTLSEEVLYFVDAFFIKYFSGGITSRVAARKTTQLPVARQAPQETEAVFRLFPNPASDEINMILTIKESGSLEITLSDMNGKQVYRYHSDYVSSGTQWIQLNNLQNLADGTYIMHLTAKGMKRQEKLMINKNTVR